MWCPWNRARPLASERQFPFGGRAQARFFAKRRKRLDEYDHYDRPLSSKSWKRLRFEGNFFEHSFQDMTPAEVSNSIFLASKMAVQNDAFWSRAALGLADLATAMTARQLTAATYSFGAISWHDEALVKSLASPLAKLAPEMKATHLATAAQAFAKMKVRHVPVLQALSTAAQHSMAAGRLKGKGVAMIAKAFAELEFYCPAFLSALDVWAASGVTSTRLDVSLDLFHSLSLLASLPASTPYPQPVALVTGQQEVSAAAMALAEALALKVKELEASQLHTLVLAMGKLRVDDAQVIRQVQRETLAELSALQTTALPPVLESFALCYQTLQQKGKDTSDPETLHEREVFLLQLSGRLARELRLLRPQEASRLLQAIDRLGLVDPRLLAMAAELVPARLAQWASEDLLALLEAYAAADNADGFMVPCLRRALIPLPQAMSRDPAAWEALDDLQMVRAAQAFSLLNDVGGLVAVLSLRRPGASDFTASCQLALASVAAGHMSNETLWHQVVAHVRDKVARDAAELGPDGRRWLEDFSKALAQHGQWCSAADAKRYQADDILLAILGFPSNVRLPDWCEALESKISECSLSLLPGLLLRLESLMSEAASPRAIRGLPWRAATEAEPRNDGSCGALRRAADRELLRRLRGEQPELELPLMAVVATFKALAKIHGRRGNISSQDDLDAEPLSEALLGSMDPLLRRLAVLADDNQLSAKATVRVLQSLQVMGLEPPTLLVMSLAKTAGSLSPQELIAALRPLTAKSIKIAGGQSLLTAVATRAMGQLKSSRQAWELDGICKTLKLEVGEVIPDEELFKEEVAQAQAG